MIPKIIHYCWFGRGEKNALAIKCIESWKKILPDYELKEWNEDNFDVNLYPYAKEALENRKFAFVTDVVRLYALYHEGGVYMDTDVEVIKTYDPFLHHHMFSGFESDNNVPTGMMAAEKGSVWAMELLNQYNNRHFVNEDGSFDQTTNTTTITNYMLEKGIILNNKYQDFPGLCTMYPSEYFCPKDHRDGIIRCTDKTICIHHFSGSWIDFSKKEIILRKLKLFFAKIFGGKITKIVADILTGRAFRNKKINSL